MVRVMPSNFDYSTLLTDDQPGDSGFDYSELLTDSAATKAGKAVQRVGDVAISLGKGVIGVPQAITGIANVFTGGEAGKAVEESGVRFKDAQDILSDLQSPEQKAANAEVAGADGFVDTAKAAIENPSTIVNSVAESLPAMGVGGVVARGGIGAAGLISRGLAEKAVPVMAGIGEGAVTAGQVAEQVRSESPDKLLTDKQAAAAAGAGIVTGGIGAAAAKLVNTKFGRMLGLSDVDALIAKGGPDAVTASAAKTGFIKSVLSSGFSEGVLEELPQSAQEQMWQNYAQGKPITEGVGNAAATGMLSGAAMGGAGGAYSSAMGGRKPSNQIDVEAGNEFLQTQADQTSANQSIEADPVAPESPSVTPEAAPVITGDVTAAIDRISELEIKASQDGLTPQEQAEHQALSQTIEENLAQENQDTLTPEEAQPEAQPTGEVQSTESIVPAESSQPFQPTHTLSDGTPVVRVDSNIYADASGNEFEDDYAEPINAEIQEKARLSGGIANNSIPEQEAPAIPAPGLSENPVVTDSQPDQQANNPVSDDQGISLSEQSQPDQARGLSPDFAQTQEPQPLSETFAPAGTVLPINIGGRKQTVRITADTEIPKDRHAWIENVEVDHGDGKGYGPASMPAGLLVDAINGRSSGQESGAGAWTIEQRKQNAAKSFMDSAMEQFELSPSEAQSALDYFQREKLVTLDGITGQFKLKHGPLWDAYALRMAAYKERFPGASAEVTGILEKAAGAKSKPVRDSYLREAETLNVAKVANVAAAKPAKNNLKSPPTGNEELQTAIRKLGGIKREGMADRAGFADFKGRKYTGLFNNGQNAKTFDEMAELLRDYGYQVDGENDLIEKLYGSINGQAYYSPSGAEAYAARLAEEAAKAAQERIEYENEIEASEERAAIQAVDDIETDEEYDEIFETVLSNDRQNTGRVTDIDLNDIFGPEAASTEKSSGAADAGTEVRRATEGGDKTRDAGKTGREGQKQQRSKPESSDEESNQANEQAGGGISEELETETQILASKKQAIAQAIAKEIIRQQNLADKARREGKKQPKESDRAKLAEQFGILDYQGYGPFDMAFGTGLNVMTQARLKMDGSKATETEIAKAVVDYIDSIKKQSNTQTTEIKGSGKKASDQSKPDQEKEVSKSKNLKIGDKIILTKDVGYATKGIEYLIEHADKNEVYLRNQVNGGRTSVRHWELDGNFKRVNDAAKTAIDRWSESQGAPETYEQKEARIRAEHQKLIDAAKDMGKLEIIAVGDKASEDTVNSDRFADKDEFLNDAAKELRSLSVASESDGDVLLGNGKFVSFADAARIVKEGVDSGELRPVPFQIHDRLDISMRDVDRVLDAIASVEAQKQNQSIDLDQQAKLDQERFKDNKIFTADKVAAARARLKSKLGTLNSGFDPELALDGMTIAGAYIESGIKAYADYTKAMVADLGEGVRPYLRSFYESVRAYPGMDTSGMTSYADLESMQVEKLDDKSPVIGEQPKVEKQKFNPLGNLTLKQDWGVEHIDGYDSERDDGKGGKIKTEFLNNTKKYLNQVADLLAKEGFEAHKDKKGKAEKPVSVNEGGPAVSGDVSLTMRKGDVALHIMVGAASVRGLSGNHPQGVSIMARVAGNADSDRYAARGMNNWLPVTATTEDLAKWAITQVGRLEDNAKFKEAQDYAKRPQNAEQAPVETGNSEADRSPRGDSQPDSGSVGGGLAEADTKTGETGNTDPGNQKAGRTRTGGGRVRAPKQLDGRNRGQADSGSRSESGAAKPDSVSLPSEPKADFTATAETAEAITEGGQKTKARANIAAIKLVKQLVAEDRRATMDEQKTLARYVGWGGIKQIFDEDNTAWSSLRTELKNILTAEEYAAANRSILDAHYTGLDVVNGMWGIAKHLGFKGGRLLEPSMGVGNFFGAMPHDMRVNSTLFGVELDNITGAIAKYLYPNARINTPVGFQDVVIPSNSFDFATGNPPFGEHSLYDKNHPEFRSFAIHQFFFAKTLDTLRPGGIQVFVVSRYLMDSRDGNGMASRKYLSENARLIGAMRLPYDAFLSNANTEVVTDIIILQKLAPGEKGNADEWTSMVDINVVHPDGTPSTFSINKYFADHPEMVLGTHSNTGKMRAKYQYNVEPIPGESLQYRIEKATKHLPKDIYKSAEKPLVELATQADEVPEGTKVYGFFMDGDKVMQRVPDSMGNRQAVQIDFKDSKAPERAKGLIKLRDALRDLMRAELSKTATSKDIEAKRATLNKVYYAFVKEHGFVNRDVNRRVMRDDPDYPLLESLEPNYDPGLGAAAAKARGEKERKPTADKADIFRERVLYPFQTLDKAETAKDALIASLNEKGGVDQDFMADIYGKPWESIEAELGDLIYQNPAGGYETADAYLSGNVKAKLKLAEESAKENPAFQRNVDALKSVQPADIPALKISVRLGSPWVDSAAMAEFAKEIFGKRTNASIRFVPQIAKWMVSIEDFDPVARVSVWGTQRMPANELLEHILNNKPIVVKDNLGTSREPQWVVNETETESARAKAQDMSAKFKEWIWQDQERRDRLAKIYNQNYNTDRRRVYDGSHLTLPGSSNTIQLRPHQKNAIWRALQDRTILLDQVVGAGKTFIMAGIAMEMRRLGIARNPMFMVPNSLVRQWRDEFYKLYPNANVLAATENDFAKVNRKRFMAKIATGDWDAVVVAHSSFKKIGMPEAQERKILDDQLKEIADAIEEMKRERGDKNVMRDMQRIKEKLEEKLKALNDRGGKKDDTVSFDELGVDALFLDEAHLFKNLFYISGMRNIAGLGNPSGSGRAFDLFVKTQFLAENYAGKAPIVFATGTPVSNSLVEMFTMQRYLAWSKLKDANIHLLDAWAGVYGDVQNVYEVHPSGTGYRLSTRFAKFVNLPSLMNLYRSFADIITMDDLKKQAIDRGEKFPVPKIKGGKPTLVVAPRSDLQTRFFGEPEFLYNEDGSIRFKYGDAPNAYEVAVDGSGKWSVIKVDTKTSVSKKYDTKEEAEEDLQRGLVTPEVAWNEGSILWKFENLKQLNKETNGKINALSITNEARKAGLDYRLINPSAPDFKDSKVNKAVENVLRIYKAWSKDKGTQLVFCDLSVPQSAKAAAASTERDAFVRREDGELKKVKATIAQIDGMDRAFLVVKMGKKEETRFMVYDGVTGADLEIEGATRAEAVKALTDASNNDLSFADKFEQFSPIEDSDIADWKDANSKEDGDDEEGDGAISMDELLSMGSTNKFSVYDDIKAKLIKKGIPEKEIAFIHDYDTAVKKGKLFDLVNAGEIRVLIGSTEKMGAGMNVQKRLVGLHHLDAPWRPSDLEQREGRIIRQGNELYKRDPDNFEVEIMRYGTKQTYDTRMWQIIEHKASGVEQLRKANDDMLEIDDVGGEAANAADMKAAASGNPLILDEIKLRNEVKSLEAQQFGHMQAKVELQERLTRNKNAKHDEEKALSSIRPFINVRDKNPSKPFRFVDDVGVPHEEIKSAEAPLVMAMTSIAKGVYGDEVMAGVYRGFEIQFYRVHSGVQVDLFLKGNNERSIFVYVYGASDNFSVSGLFSRIDNALSRIDDQVEKLKKETQDRLDEIPTIEKELGKPFAKEDQLKEARAKHRNVVNQLAKSGGGIELTDAMKKELDAALAARGLSDTRLSIGANTAPTPSLVDLFEKMGKRSSKSATIDHPQADLIRAIQDGGWQDVLLQVGYEKADKSDNPNGKVFIQC